LLDDGHCSNWRKVWAGLVRVMVLSQQGAGSDWSSRSSLHEGDLDKSAVSNNDQFVSYDQLRGKTTSRKARLHECRICGVTNYARTTPECPHCGVLMPHVAMATRNGPGTVADALTGFEVRAGRLPAGPGPDLCVAVTYALGWAVGDALTCARYQVFEHLVKVPEFDAPADQWNLLVNQIISRCGQLNDHLKSAQADIDLSAELQTAASLRLGSSWGDVKTAIGEQSATVMQLHTGIVMVLWSVASPLAKSYQLGLDMEQMCVTPVAGPSITVTASVKAHDAEIHQLLTALASRLPANAAHATDNSLLLWSASLSAGGEESPANLLRQGRRWYDALVGEVPGKDGLLATFGLTWKGLGKFFGRAAVHAEEQLWAAELDWAIAYRLTMLHWPPSDNVLKARSKALDLDRSTKEHLRRYKQWKRTWPDVLTG
jgi:hypothetical protein